MTFEELHDSMKEIYGVSGPVLWMGLNEPSAIVESVDEIIRDGRRLWYVSFDKGPREIGCELREDIAASAKAQAAI